MARSHVANVGGCFNSLMAEQYAYIAVPFRNDPAIFILKRMPSAVHFPSNPNRVSQQKWSETLLGGSWLVAHKVSREAQSILFLLGFLLHISNNKWSYWKEFRWPCGAVGQSENHLHQASVGEYAHRLTASIRLNDSVI